MFSNNIINIINGKKTNYRILMGYFNAKVGTGKGRESSLRKFRIGREMWSGKMLVNSSLFQKKSDLERTDRVKTKIDLIIAGKAKTMTFTTIIKKCLLRKL